MNGTVSFQDIFKKSILESGAFSSSITWGSIINASINMLLALVIGLLLYFIYKKTFRGVVFSRSFALSLIGMTVLTAAIIVTISSNVVLSLGMVGALSIVRYRTAVKDPLDLMFLFWSVAAGIAAGAGMFYIAIIASVIMIVLLLCFSVRKGKREEVYVLLVHYSGADIGDGIRRILGALPYQIRSRTMRKRDVEMAIEVRVKNKNLTFTERIGELEGVQDVTLVQYNGDYID